jgi:hypothetical protein
MKSLVNDELDKMWEKLAIAGLDVVFWNLRGGTGANH